MRSSATAVGGLLLVSVVALVLGSGGAVAQEAAGTLTVNLGEADPITPDGTGTVPITVTVDCSLVITAGADGATLTFDTPQVPSWAAVAFDPPTATIDPAACAAAATSTTVDASALVAADAGAPALAPATLEVSATLTRAAGDVTGANTTDVQAAYWGAISVNATTATAEGAPGATLTYAFTATNSGNGDTMVMFTVSVPDGWNATAPTSITLAPGDSNDFEVTVVLPAGAGADADETLTLSFSSHFVLDGNIVGPTGTTDVQAALRIPPPEENDTPVPPMLAVAGAALAAVGLARRR